MWQNGLFEVVDYDDTRHSDVFLVKLIARSDIMVWTTTEAVVFRDGGHDRVRKYSIANYLDGESVTVSLPGEILIAVGDKMSAVSLMSQIPEDFLDEFVNDIRYGDQV